ncbi:MAG: hypothetical protein HFJ05_02065 [Eubacterium sp.]|nr:hypothetical protein [Eubacterium sp.]
MKNILTVVKDIEKSKQFYHDLFGLDLLLDNDGNMILTEGLVLRDEKIWKNFLGKICLSEPSECMPAGRAIKTPPHGFFHAAALL